MSLEADVKRAAALARLDGLIRRVIDRGPTQTVEFDDLKLVIEGLQARYDWKTAPGTVTEFIRAWCILNNPDRVIDVAQWLRREML